MHLQNSSSLGAKVSTISSTMQPPNFIIYISTLEINTSWMTKCILKQVCDMKNDYFDNILTLITVMEGEKATA